MDTDSIQLGSVASLSAPLPEPPSVNTPQQKGVDKGYAWVIMFAMFGTMFFHSPMVSINTLVYQEYLIRFNISAATAGGVLALPDSIRFMSSPAVGLLFQKFSHRTIGMTGAVLLTTGILFFGFATGMWMLYTGSVLYGLGGNMIIMSSFVIIPAYFVRKRGLAMGIGLCGSTVGFILNPLLFSRSFSYFGYTQTLIFIACVTMQVVVTSSLYRPPQTVIKPDTEHTPSDKSKWQLFRERSGLTLLGQPIVVCYMIAVSFLHVMFGVATIFVSGLAIENTNMTSNEIAVVLSIAAFSTFSKLPIGLCFDVQILRPYRMYLFCIGCNISGCLGTLLAFASDKISFTICYVLFFAFLAGTHSQYVTVLGDIVKLEELPNALALTRTVIGVIYLFGPTAAGKIKDVWDSFKYGFISISIIYISIVTGFMLMYFCWKRLKH